MFAINSSAQLACGFLPATAWSGLALLKCFVFMIWCCTLQAQLGNVLFWWPRNLDYSCLITYFFSLSCMRRLVQLGRIKSIVIFFMNLVDFQFESLLKYRLSITKTCLSFLCFKDHYYKIIWDLLPVL